MQNLLSVHKKRSSDILPNLENYDKEREEFTWKDTRPYVDWFGGKINAAYNAVDRHEQTWRKNKVALYWEDEAGSTKKYTFEELFFLSNKVGNILKDFGVGKGDRVFLFLPRIPELFYSFLGILKIGAIAGTLFSAFQEQALLDRLENAGAKVLLTTKELKPRVDKIRKKLPDLRHVLVVDEEAFSKSMENASEDLHVAHLDPDDYAFMLYTSGTTGKPKGVVHSHRAIIQEHMTARWVLDLKDDDTYWCTADPGWVTGIAYEILGSWSNGVAALVFAGRFDPDRWYQLLDKYNINTPMMSYHTHSKISKIDKILELLEKSLPAGRQGKNLALVSDAGTPTISDPGAILIAKIRECQRRPLTDKMSKAVFDIEVIPVPGASAFVTALSASGFSIHQFTFLGFLPHKKGRETLFKEISNANRTIVFYESPHRILKTLESLNKFCPNKKICIARELTKIYEEFKIGTAEELLKYLNENKEKQRGEFTIIVE